MKNRNNQNQRNILHTRRLCTIVLQLQFFHGRCCISLELFSHAQIVNAYVHVGAAPSTRHVATTTAITGVVSYRFLCGGNKRVKI